MAKKTTPNIRNTHQLIHTIPRKEKGKTQKQKKTNGVKKTKFQWWKTKFCVFKWFYRFSGSNKAIHANTEFFLKTDSSRNGAKKELWHWLSLLLCFKCPHAGVGATWKKLYVPRCLPHWKGYFQPTTIFLLHFSFLLSHVCCFSIYFERN